MKIFATLLIATFICNIGNAQSFQLLEPGGIAFNANHMTHLLEDTDGSILCLTRGDSILMRYKNNQWTYIGSATNGFMQSGSSANDFELLPNGNIWVVQFTTIDEWDGSAVTNLTSSNSNLQNDFVVSTAIKSNGEIWLGYNNGFGLSRKTGNTWAHKGDFTGGLATLNNIFTPKLLEVNRLNSDIWIIYSSNLYKVTNSSITTYAINTTGIPSPSSSNFKAMTVTADGKVWFALTSNTNDPDEGGLLSFDNGTWTHYNTDNSSISTNNITALTHYGNSVIFSSYLEEGISILDNGTFTSFNSSNSNFPVFPSFHIRDLLKKDSKIFAATDAGLLIMEMPYPSQIEEIATQELSLFPNPANSVIRFDFLNQLEVFDIRGALVLSCNNANELDISVLPQGYYLVTGINKENNIINGSFIKE